MTKSRGILRRKRFWTEVEIRLLIANYADSRTEDIATVIGRDVNHVFAKATELGLRKTPAYLAQMHERLQEARRANGLKCGFKKGHVPANKGRRRPGWAAGRMRDTQFRPGIKGNRTMPIGAHRVIDGVVWRKVSELPNVAYTVNWRAVHRLVWEAAHGPVPAGHVLRFKPDMKTLDPTLISVDRLELITQRENMLRNTLHNLPKPLVQLIQLRGTLNRSINRKARRDAQQSDHQ
jgi:hypothetical protein